MARSALPVTALCVLFAGCQLQNSSVRPAQSSVKGWLNGNSQPIAAGQKNGNIAQVSFERVQAGSEESIPPESFPGHRLENGENGSPPGAGPVPRELAKVSLPPYVIEPPDILLIDAIRMVPRPPYKLEPMDVVGIQAADTLPNQPIAGIYTVAPEGTVNLGYSYGMLSLAGLTVDDAQVAIAKHLGRMLQNPQVAVSLIQFRGLQQTRGEHLVRPDGTISLGSYGGVYVTGLTIEQSKYAIERHLSRWLLNPEISLDIFAYNSKVYYVITDGAGYGEQVFRFPSTGNETVLDAISQIYGLPAVASKKKIWIARPAPYDHPCDQVLPVDWQAITEGGSTCTNYQVFPGDRIYVKADCLIRADNILAKVVAPVERLFGITLLGSSTWNSIRNQNVATPVIPF